MKNKSFPSFKDWWRENWRVTIISLCGLLFVCSCTYGIFKSYYHVEYLEYVNADFEWIDDFGNYEVVIVHEDQPHYLTVKDNKVKFIYANEDFLNFVVVDHAKRIYDGQNQYWIKIFYINLNYKEIQND